MWLFLLLFSLKAQEFAINKQTAIDILGGHLLVQIAQSDTSVITWSCASPCEIQPQSSGSVVQIRLPSKQQLELKVPRSVQINVYGKEGDIQIHGLENALKFRFVEAKVKAKNTKGLLDMSLSKGNVDVEDHSGNLIVDFYDASLIVKNANGKHQISQFSGTQTLEGLIGKTDVLTQNAKSIILGGSGELNYKTTRGTLSLKNYKGDIHGESANGKSLLIPSSGSKLFWKADLGQVNVKAQNGSTVDVATKQGILSLINPLKVTKEKGWNVARAKLSGVDSGANLIRTNRASIRIEKQ